MKYLRFSLALIFCQNLFCQSNNELNNYNAVQILIHASKESYFVFEPIEIKVELKNVSSMNQQFGPLGILAGNLRYRLFDFNNKEILKYNFLSNYSPGGWLLNSKTAIKPDSSAKDSFLISYYFNFNKAGAYILEIGYPIFEAVDMPNVKYKVKVQKDYKIEKIKIVVKNDPKVDTAQTNYISKKIDLIMDSNIMFFNKKVNDSIPIKLLEISKADCPRYIKETTIFYSGMYYYNKSMITGNDDYKRKTCETFHLLLEGFTDSEYKSIISKEKICQ